VVHQLLRNHLAVVPAYRSDSRSADPSALHFVAVSATPCSANTKIRFLVVGQVAGDLKRCSHEPDAHRAGKAGYGAAP